jgi:hypothetical protein
MDTFLGRGGISSVVEFEPPVTQFDWDFMESGCRLEGGVLVGVGENLRKYPLKLEPFGHFDIRIVHCIVQGLGSESHCSRTTIGYN